MTAAPSERLAQIYQRRPDIVARRILDEHLLVPIRGQLADMQRVFALNAVAAFVWEALDGKRNLAQIATSLVAAFTVEQAAAEHDLLELTETLLREGLIKLITV